MDEVCRPFPGFVPQRGTDAGLPANHPTQAQPPHQALDGTPSDAHAFTVELRPDLVGPVHAEMLPPDPLDGLLQGTVTDCPR